MLRMRRGFFAVLLMAAMAAAGTNAAAAGTPDGTATSGELVDEEFAELLLEEEVEAEARVSVPDPLIHFNRAVFVFNDRLYFWVLKPLASGYKTVVPEPARTCVKNVFHNLAAPVRIVNGLLQGKPRLAEAALGHFVVNTIVGIGGLGDPAADYPHLNPGDEDLGQTLGVWGVENGIYLVLPFFGPSTLRDTVGMIGDRFLDPMTYTLTTAESAGASGVRVVNATSFRIGEYESLKAAALEPYVAFRDGYIQYRLKKVSE